MQLECDRKLKKYREEVQTIQNQLRELNAQKAKPTSEIVITISSDKAQTVNLKAMYIIPTAGWTAQYDLRAINISKPIALVYKAEIYQNSGFDWDGVDLTLSTGEPFRSGTKPELKTWWLNFNSYGGGNNQNNAYKQNSTTHTFKIENPYTIPTDGKKHSIEIIKYSLPSEYEYFAVPKKDKDAFLVARITDWEQYHLMNGNINLFFEGTFIGNSNLNVNVPQDTLNISLGRDKNIIVERTKVKNFTKQRIIGTKKVVTYQFEIKLRNNKTESVHLTIED